MTSSPGSSAGGGRGAERRSPARCPRSGFTLVELLAVLAIIALVGGLGAGAYQVARRNYALSASAGRIQGVLRAARNTALGTGIPTTVVVDPLRRTITATAYEIVGEWSFDLGAEEAAGAAIVGSYSNRGAAAVPGILGSALSFRAPGSYVDCGTPARFDLRTSVAIEAWVRHDMNLDVPPPATEAAGARGGTSRLRRSATTRAAAAAAADVPPFTVLSKGGAYFLGMLPDGSLEGAVGDYRVRTRPGVVPPGRWVRVSFRFDGTNVELASDGVNRQSQPLGQKTGGLRGEGPVLPITVPVTPQPLTISSGEQGFPGEIDEVRLSGGTEPVEYRWGDGEHVPGWKKVVRFDGRGHLDARHHTEDVSLVLADVELDAVTAQPRTAVAADYSVTFEEWLARSSDPPPLREKVEEARLVAALGAARRIVIEVDRLGNVK